MPLFNRNSFRSLTNEQNGQKYHWRLGTFPSNSFNSSSRPITSLCANSASRTRASGWDTGDDPLPHVAREVQDQIPDVVRFLVSSPPDLFVRHFLQTAFNLRQIVAQQKVQGMIDESSRTVLSGATLDIVVAGDLGPSFVLNARLSTT